ncbi:MAG: hypothetical protein IPP91_01520 [Betaproteobacteria bacterium]|nr:hypothetical protein [Betaproteobacteria bacterium]
MLSLLHMRLYVRHLDHEEMDAVGLLVAHNLGKDWPHAKLIGKELELCNVVIGNDNHLTFTSLSVSIPRFHGYGNTFAIAFRDEIGTNVINVRHFIATAN